MSDIPTIKGVHHSAFLCRDAAETRDFYCGVLGMRLRAGLVIETRPGTDIPLKYMHLFFEMADGNYIAFFDLPDSVSPEDFRQKDSMKDYHFAMELADLDELHWFKERLEAHGLAVRGPTDHRFCHSIYFHDPNGLQLEFTVRDACHDAVLDGEEAKLDEVMRRWTAETAAIKAARLKPVAAE